MARYIVRRIAGMFLLLIMVSAVTFVVFNVFPSTDPAALRAGRQPTPEVIERIRQDLGLDRPLYVQFGDYIWKVFAPHDLGVFSLQFLGGQGSYVPFSEDPVRWLQSLILPWCVLATAFEAVYA